MLSLFLSLALLSGAPPPAQPSVQLSAEIYRSIPLEDISNAVIGDFFPFEAPDGERDAFLFMNHGGTILVTSLDLVEIDAANMELAIRVAAEGDKPAVFRTVYVDRDGRTHEIVTDCRRYATFKSCAEAHGKAVAAMEEVFPRGGAIIDFNELDPRYKEEGEDIVRTSGEGGVVILPGLILRIIQNLH